MAAFTIIELSMVAAILGILAVAAYAKFANVTTFTSRFFFDDVRSSLRYAQKYAVGTGCRVQVSVTSTTLTLTQASACTSGNFSPGVAVRDPSNTAATSYTRTAPSGITITNITGDWPIVFDGLGKAYRNAGTSGTNANPYTLTVGGTNISVIGETGFTQ